LSSATTRNAFVPRLWASRRIASLIDEIRQAGAVTSARPSVVGESLLDDPRHAELVDEILRLSTKFGILTEYTAFLAREGTDLSNWNDLKVGCSGELQQKAVRTRSGLGAVTQSLNCASQKGQIVLNYGNRFVDDQLQPVGFDGVQQISDRAFFKRGNRWLDSRVLTAGGPITPDRTCALGTEAHTTLLRRLVDEGRQGMLSLRGEILLVVDGEIVLVTESALVPAGVGATTPVAEDRMMNGPDDDGC